MRRGKGQNRQEPWFGKNQLAMAVIQTGLPEGITQGRLRNDIRQQGMYMPNLCSHTIVTVVAPIRCDDNPSLFSHIDYVAEHYKVISFIMAANCEHQSFIAYITKQEARHTEQATEDREAAYGGQAREANAPSPSSAPSPARSTAGPTLPDARLFGLQPMAPK